MSQPRHFPTAWRGPLPGHEFVTCSDCSGSGEGRYEGQRCGTCGGSGEVEVEVPEQAQPAPAAPALPDKATPDYVTTIEVLRAHITRLESAAPAVREPLTDGLVAHLEQMAFASTNHMIERPVYQHWFRVGVRAGYGITGDSASAVPGSRK